MLKKFIAASLLMSSTAYASSISLIWDYTSTANQQDGFKVERKLGQASTAVYDEIGFTDKMVFTYSDTTAQEGQVYCYRVRAFIQELSIFSKYSNEACAAALLAPVSLRITDIQ